MENILEVLRKIKNKTPYDPNSTSGYLFEGNEKKDMCTPMFTAALFAITKIWKQPKCPSVDE